MKETNQKEKTVYCTYKARKNEEEYQNLGMLNAGMTRGESRGEEA